MYTARGKGGREDFLTDEGGVLIKKGSIILWIFLIKDHLNYSMLEDSLLAYLLYKINTLFTGLSLSIIIKVKCFYCKANCF